MTADDLALTLEAYESLLSHPGWKLLAEELRKRAEATLSQMRGARTSEELSRKSTEYLMLLDIMKAPEVQRASAEQRLNAKLNKS